MAGAGISTMCMLHSTLQAVLETVGSAFSHVEVVCEGNHTDLEVLESYDFTVSFHAPFSDLNLASLNAKIQIFHEKPRRWGVYHLFLICG